MEQQFKDFIIAVERMRYLQKLYFSTRSREVLQQSKEAERLVDNLIKEFNENKLRLF